MSDTIYDAVRSRISNGDIGEAVERAIRDMDIAGMAQRACHSIESAASCYESPSAIYRPAISMDGNKWCALYGDNLQDGVAGFGDSPAQAMADFDKHWLGKK